MKFLYAITLLLAALLSGADSNLPDMFNPHGGRSFPYEDTNDDNLPVQSTVPGGKSLSYEEEDTNDDNLPVQSTVPGGQSVSYEDGDTNDGNLPVQSTVPGGQSVSYENEDTNDDYLPVQSTVPGGKAVSYEDGDTNDVNLPVPTQASDGHSFSYEGENGPEHWAKHFPACAGKFQSPIDIEEHLVKSVRLQPLVFRGFNTVPIRSTLSNNGHTVMVQMDMISPALLSGGPLIGDYVFHQLHFHWGNNDSVGSEDTINNLTFPLQMHIVTYKQMYGSFDYAINYPDGLAVLAVFFEIFGNGNPYYSAITQQLPLVTQPNSQVLLRYGVTLLSLLPETKHLYFTYHGSLTTPPCLEVVTWIEFKQPILLNHNQVEAFRTMQSPDGNLTFNFRPIQPLSERIVLFNVADNIRRGKWAENSAVSPFVTSFMLGIFLVLMLVVLQQ